jgi:hypothetical protein
VDSGGESHDTHRARTRGLRPSVTAYGAGGCSARVTPVGIDAWTAGGIALRATAALSSTRAGLAKPEGQKVDGAIGADVLSGFASITVDLAHQRLILSPTEP